MQPRDPSLDPIVALLEWYSANGVDIAIEEVAIDRLTPRAASVQTETAVQVKAMPATVPPASSHSGIFQRPLQKSDAPVDTSNAKALAAAATTLDELRVALESFEECPLKLTAKTLVFADGNPAARVMLVGEAPGREEDLQGLPFVGRSGQLLDRMLAAIGLSRDDVYIANVVPWRPPGNRTPTPQETALCRPFIDRQIALVDPDFLICLGGSAAKELMNTTEGILRLRGQWQDFDTGVRTIRAMATLHPAYLLRQPLQKRLVWRDLLGLRAAINGRLQ